MRECLEKLLRSNQEVRYALLDLGELLLRLGERSARPGSWLCEGVTADSSALTFWRRPCEDLVDPDEDLGPVFSSFGRVLILEVPLRDSSVAFGVGSSGVRYAGEGRSGLVEPSTSAAQAMSLGRHGCRAEAP